MLNKKFRLNEDYKVMYLAEDWKIVSRIFKDSEFGVDLINFRDESKLCLEGLALFLAF